MNVELKDLAWDTEYFGVKSAKFTVSNSLTNKEFEELMAKAQEYEFVVINNINNDAINNMLIGSKSNSFLVDVNIQFEATANINNAEPYYEAENNIQINNMISEISSNSFNFSRFYNDPNIDVDLSKEIYLNWVKNSFNKTDKYFLVSHDEEETLGFLLFSISNEKEVVIELISLDEKAQGKGIGTKLLKSLHFFCCRENIKTIKVGTQLDNLQAINFYQKKGFNLVSKTSIYHYWPRKEFSND